jgi:hypothetical protein
MQTLNEKINDYAMLTGITLLIAYYAVTVVLTAASFNL